MRIVLGLDPGFGDSTPNGDSNPNMKSNSNSDSNPNGDSNPTGDSIPKGHLFVLGVRSSYTIFQDVLHLQHQDMTMVMGTPTPHEDSNPNRTLTPTGHNLHHNSHKMPEKTHTNQQGKHLWSRGLCQDALCPTPRVKVHTKPKSHKHRTPEQALVLTQPNKQVLVTGGP